jgi:hypothetical protein
MEGGWESCGGLRLNVDDISQLKKPIFYVHGRRVPRGSHSMRGAVGWWGSQKEHRKTKQGVEMEVELKIGGKKKELSGGEEIGWGEGNWQNLYSPSSSTHNGGGRVFSHRVSLCRKLKRERVFIHFFLLNSYDIQASNFFSFCASPISLGHFRPKWAKPIKRSSHFFKNFLKTHIFYSTGIHLPHTRLSQFLLPTWPPNSVLRRPTISLSVLSFPSASSNFYKQNPTSNIQSIKLRKAFFGRQQVI